MSSTESDHLPVVGQVDNPGYDHPVLRADGITRRFPGVLANDHIDFDLRAGEVHALLGENGSGKTTLCKILTGLYRPDSGRIVVDGKQVTLGSPRDAYTAGIFMVQQHFSLVERLTVAENVILGWSRHSRLRLGRRSVEEQVAATADKFHIAVNPSAYVWQLSMGERQRVEILKALYRGTRMLILDEPTTVLTPQECDALFGTMRQLANNGTAIIFISHKLREVLAVCDRVTVLRQGKTLATRHVRDDQVDTRSLAALMVGRDVTMTRKTSPPPPPGEPNALEVRGVSVRNDFGNMSVVDVSLTVSRGEIVGLAGVAGNGQRELAEAIVGLRRRASGTVIANERSLHSGEARASIKAGMAYIPEDRMGTGLAPSLTVTENLILKSFRTRRFSRGPVLRGREIRSHGAALLKRFDVRGTQDSVVGQLSGGNAQKVVLARELDSSPGVVLAACPTRGLDVAATQTVRALLLEAAAAGGAVLLISEDLDEVLDLSDRVAVLYEGRIAGIADPATTSREDIGLLMAGVHPA